MVKPFPLAGLLRLRHLQEDKAAAELAAANARLRTAADRRARARETLDTSMSEVRDSATLGALAAARASSRSMLADLDALRNRYQTEAAEAERGYSEARLHAVSLEKLETKHTEAQAAEELRAEQTVLDELASAAWHRARKEED